jgi:hypothetical protein
MSQPNGSRSVEPPSQALDGIQKTFQETLAQQRRLWDQVSQFTKNESLHFAKQQTDFAKESLETLQGSKSPQDILVRQQEWLRRLVKDYTDQSLRYTEMFQSLARNAFTTGMTAGQDAMRKAQEMGEEASEQFQETTETIRRSAESLTDQNGSAGTRTSED